VRCFVPLQRAPPTRRFSASTVHNALTSRYAVTANETVSAIHRTRKTAPDPAPATNSAAITRYAICRFSLSVGGPIDPAFSADRLLKCIDVINVFLRFFNVFLFFPLFYVKKRCQMQSINMQKSNEKYS